MDHVKKILLLLGLISVAQAAPNYYEKTQEPPGTAVYAKGYGVKADAKSGFYTASITSGAAILTATSTPGPAFTAADVGKLIFVPGAGAAGAVLATTIAGFTSGTVVTLTANASTTLSAVVSTPITWGTDDSVALGAAAVACNTVGGRLILPPGGILLNGASSTHVLLNGCAMSGTGGNAAYLSSNNEGTTFFLTSTTVVPFYLARDFGVRDVIFYHPNQTSGTTTYPSIFTDGTTAATQMAHGAIDHIDVINAWDILTITAGLSTADVKVTNSTMWSNRYAFSLHNVGDIWSFDNDHFTPGAWLQYCDGSAACATAVNAGPGTNGNAIFHCVTGGACVVHVTGLKDFDYRYAVLLDSGSSLGNSDFDMKLDNTGTVIDSSSGGLVASSVPITGFVTTCGVSTYTGLGGGSFTVAINSSVISPCFNLGSGSGIYIHNMRFDGPMGDFIYAAGNNAIRIVDIQLGGIGLVHNGTDFYFLHGVAVPQNLRMYDSYIVGRLAAADAHQRGIVYDTANSHSTGAFVMKGNVFNYMSDVVTMVTSQIPVLENNSSFNTYASGYTLNMTGTGRALSSDNYWDIDPTATLPVITRADAPTNIWNWGIPVIMPSSGDFNAGVVTLTTALPDAKWCSATTGCYMYFPSGAICATCISAGASPAGVYYCQNSATSTTVFNCFNNVLATGEPITIASPTAFTSPGDPAGYTQSTSIQTLLTLKIPGTSMGPQGSFEVRDFGLRPNTVNAVTHIMKFGTTTFATFNTVSVLTYGQMRRTVRNLGSPAVQIVFPATVDGGEGTTSTTAPTFMAELSGNDKNLLLTATLAVATDYFIIGGGTVSANYGASF